MKITLLITLFYAITFFKTTAQSFTPEHKKEGKITSTGSWIHDKAEEIHGLKMGPFVRLADGSILTVDHTESHISQDQGQTWTAYAIFPNSDKFEIRPERTLLKTRNGIIILAFAK